MIKLWERRKVEFYQPNSGRTNERNKGSGCPFFKWLDEVPRGIHTDERTEMQAMKLRIEEMEKNFDEMQKKMQQLQDIVANQRSLGGNSNWKVVFLLAFSMWFVMYLMK